MQPRLLLWTAGSLVSAAAFGLAWLTTMVEVPVWGLLLLTFVPTRELTDAFRATLRRLQEGSDG